MTAICLPWWLTLLNKQGNVVNYNTDGGCKTKRVKRSASPGRFIPFSGVWPAEPGGENVRLRSNLVLFLFNVFLEGQSSGLFDGKFCRDSHQTVVGVDDVGPDLV